MKRFIQINLHHAKGASAIFCRRFMKQNIDVGLIQEPWINNGKIKGISALVGKLLYDDSSPNPRAAIIVKNNTNFIPITEFISRDIVAIQLEVPTVRGSTWVCIASAYFPGNTEEAPPSDVTSFISYCKKMNKQFIVGCDANAHHTVWGSTNINNRGESLLNYITTNNIDFCNKGNCPTFVTATRQEVLDLTFCSEVISERIINWKVSDEISLSDHKQIGFE